MKSFARPTLEVDEETRKVYMFKVGRGAPIPVSFDLTDKGWRVTKQGIGKPNEFYDALDDALAAVQERLATMRTRPRRQ